MCQDVPIDIHSKKVADMVKACVALHQYLICINATNTMAVMSHKTLPSVTASSWEKGGEWRRLLADNEKLIDPRCLSNKG